MYEKILYAWANKIKSTFRLLFGDIGVLSPQLQRNGCNYSAGLVFFTTLSSFLPDLC